MTALQRITATKKPAWVTYADRRVDISDIWAEQTDPNGERADVCTAYLESTVPLAYYPMEGGPDPRDGMKLTGIAITDEGGTIYRDRAWAVKMLGADAVWRVEDCEMESV